MKQNYRYDSSYNSEHKDKLQELVEYILDNKKYGDTLSNAEASRILMINWDSSDDKEKNRYRALMGRVKNFLIEKGYILKGISGIGYYILKPKQVAGHCYRTYMRKTMNLLDKSERILRYTDKTELKGDRIEEYDNVVELNKNLSDGILKEIQDSKYYNRMEHYNSLIEEK